ncbi:MAG: Toxin-antitoxin system, toxin component, Fic family [Candidatus Collierbacteria bacterium GW2011_GWC2_44_18]|uniref:Toxin-antitoxin system, toxin component, Fic family n=2 Tax=Microgenomates group TaxID=1794810 RepID=A0A0G1KMY2_9BACT|nr:MAG: Toxin-antitoxin system, toxin component, Fic family [Candidatus Collierbacteria bacterium GW2011_GWC2_44_18]
MEVEIYKSSDGEIQMEVKLKKDTIWLSQAQMANLFEIDRTVISKHINNIFKSNELKEISNVQKMHITGTDKPTKFYNLDLIISVGYRVNSKKATQFRIWATRILKQHLLRGYSVNEKLLLA